MNRYLIVVDMQNDFISGALGSGEAKKILPAAVKKVKGAVGKKAIYFTMDTHGEGYLETSEGRDLPVPHCIKHTAGWQIAGELKDVLSAEGQKPEAIEKGAFGSAELALLLQEQDKREKIDEIEIIGLCTDICVISNAMLLKAFLPEVKITVDASCCAGVTLESHRNALSAMKMCHIEITGE